MKTIGLEEHFVTTAVIEAWSRLEPQWQNPPGLAGDDDLERRLAEVDGERLAAREDTGLDAQVLSLTSPGVQNVPPGDAVALQVAANDLVAEAVRAHPDRLQGFATLATTDPAGAARELDRAITTLGLNGALIFPRSRGRALDERDFWPIFEAAAARNAYYSGFDDAVNAGFATYGIGWHYEVGVALIRLILAGVFDQFPDLQIVVGHWGELVLFYLDKIDLTAAASLKCPVSEYLRSNVFVTPSGVFSQRYLRWAVEVMGSDRILFSTYYPYRFVSDGGARRFLEDAELTEADREMIGSGNWERLCAAIRR